MISLYSYTAPLGDCGYLPDRQWQMEYDVVTSMTAAEYEARMAAGWRRFGHMMFRPRCPSCSQCRSLRIDVARFQPNRSQRRNLAANRGVIMSRAGQPSVTPAKLALYDRYHLFQAGHKGWDERPPKDVHDYRESFVTNPFPTQEWCYYLHNKLVGVGYVDRLPRSLSAIYFIYEPAERERGLGVFNVLTLVEYAKQMGIPHVYLGYYVDGCGSLSYKANYGPHELLDASGAWVPVK